MLYYKIYIVYRDLITMLIICILHFIIIPNFKFIGAFVSEIQKCFSEAINLLLYYKIYIVYIDLITTLIIGVLHFTITPISTFIRASVSKIQ